jgi:hypothetical protein
MAFRLIEILNIKNRKTMSDDLKNRSQQDRVRISLEQDWEVAYWTKKFNCSKEELRKAVEKAGNSAEAVAKQLGH